MKAGTYSADELRAVSVSEITSYLARHGWSAAAHDSEFADIWHREALENSPEVLVPTRADLTDYALRVGDLLRTLETWESRSPLDILRDWALASADVIRLRRPTQDSMDESIVLHDGAALINQAMSLMTAAACAVIAPHAVVPSRRPPQALDYLRRVRMGQTEKGSYVLTIVSKVTPLLTPGAPGLLEFMDEPFPRRVTRMLVRSLEALNWASEQTQATGDFSSFTDRIDDGVSANLCDAIRGMVSREDFEAEIGVLVTWSSAPPSPPGGSPAFQFKPSQAPLLLEASEHLRRWEPQQGALITGVIVGLHRQEGQWDGRVTVACVIEGSVRQLQVPLPGADYQLAVDAHGDQKQVIFRADIQRLGRSYRASNISEFKVIG